MRYPRLTPLSTKKEIVDTFKGYDRSPRIGDGWFCDMRNLSSDRYPLMSVRKQRGTVVDIDDLPPGEKPRSGTITGVVHTDRCGLMYTQGDGLYLHAGRNSKIELGLSDTVKTFALMGTYLIILPDMKYVDLGNMQNYGPLGHRIEANSGTVNVALCDSEGKRYGVRTVSDTAPEAPNDGALWVDTSADVHSLKKYSGTRKMWIPVSTTCVRISGSFSDTDGMWFSKYDGVTISGLSGDAVNINGAAVVQDGSSRTSVLVTGMIDEDYSQECTEEQPIRIERAVPMMDYVVESGNRLWGCRYGENSNGDFVNEIYCSKLGDPKNWSCFMGIATDSWVGSVGSPGRFTGAAVIGEHPVFYKTDIKHKVWISESGAHQITSTPCSGVKYGCSRSVASIDGAVIYKSERGFCIDDGGVPVEFGQCFAGEEYSEAASNIAGSKYYVSMKGTDGWRLFVYDIEKRLWHLEDDLHVMSFSSDSGFAFAVLGDGSKIVDISSGLHRRSMEGPVRWMAELGPMGLETPNMKRIFRIVLRLAMEIGSEVAAYIRYDSEAEWTYLFGLKGSGLRSFSVPVRPRRCDHFQLRLEGVGDVRLYSITKEVLEGSERTWSVK